MAARRILNGTPGTVWKNTTGKVRYQLLVSWHNSCGRCIALDHAISTSQWPLPLHPRCLCKSLPIYPGHSSEPFIDFREQIDALPSHRRADVIGKAALALVDKHVLRWPDIVTKDRVKPLHELVAKHKLTVEKMTAAGVDRRTAQRAFDRAHGHDAEALAEAHRKAQAEVVAAKAEAQRQAKETARRRLEEAEAKVKARPRKLEVAPAEVGSAKVLADYLRRGKVKVSAIEKVVAGRFGKINAEAETARLREAARQKAKAKVKAQPSPAPALVSPPVPTPAPVGMPDYQALRARIEERVAGSTRPSVQNRAVWEVLREHGFHEAATVRARAGGMAVEETFHAADIGGIRFHYPPLSDTFNPLKVDPLVAQVRSLMRGEWPPPEPLARHTREVYLTRQANKDDDHWRTLWNDPTSVSAASAAKGSVFIYNGGSLGVPLMHHEMGHNLAHGTWGSYAPAPDSEYRRAIASGEPPVSDYARHNAAEDFAEGVRAYFAEPERMAKESPLRHAAIDRMMREEVGERAKVAQAKPEVEVRAKAEVEAEARRKAEAAAQAEAERKAREQEEAARRAVEEARRKVEAEQARKKAEAARKAIEEAKRYAREEAERKRKEVEAKKAAARGIAAVPGLDPDLPAYREQTAKVAEKHADALSKIAQKLKTTPAALKEKVEGQVKGAVDAGELYLRTPMPVVGKILKDGRFKSQFETDTSNGELNAEGRYGAEAALMGVAPESPVKERPIYGYISTPDFSSAGTNSEHRVDQYGQAIFRLKPHVRERATFTMGDSLTLRDLVVAAPVAAPDASAVPLSGRSYFYHATDLTADLPPEEKLKQYAAHHLYVEAQYHGGLGMDDVAEVAFRVEPPAEVKAGLEARGIPWRIYQAQ